MLEEIRVRRPEAFRSGYPSGVCVGTFEVVLHYFYTSVDVADALDPSSNNYLSVKEAERHGLLALSKGSNHAWEITERGKVLAKAIMALPLPEQRWIMYEVPK